MSDLAEALIVERLHNARLRAVLEKTAGALACRLPPMLHVTFSGRWRHLGRLSVGAILDEANAALSPGAPSEADAYWQRELQELIEAACEVVREEIGAGQSGALTAADARFAACYKAVSAALSSRAEAEAPAGPGGCGERSTG